VKNDNLVIRHFEPFPLVRRSRFLSR
jgi:hypothetical protein